MDIEEIKEFCEEKLNGNCSSCEIEEAKGMNEESRRYVVCHVEDEAKALCSLWRNICDEKVNEQMLKHRILCISIKDNGVKLARSVILEEFGCTPIDDILRYSKTYRKFDNIINSKTYIDDGSSDVHDAKVKDFILDKGIDVVLVDG